MSKENTHEKDTIITANGSYRKHIVAKDNQGNSITSRLYKRHYFFELPVGKKVKFSLNVLHAKNKKATAQFVYWIAQNHSDFKSTKFLRFIKKGEVVKNKHKLFEALNKLNRGTIYGQKNILVDGEEMPNPKYVLYTPENTGYVDEGYLATTPYSDKEDEEHGIFSYTPQQLGKGVWIEGFNYRPEFKEQGAFIIGVDTPQIVSIFAEKRTRPEKLVRSGKVSEEDVYEVEKELLYGQYIDIHIRLHNVLRNDYDATFDVLFEDESLNDGYTSLFNLELPEHNENPSLEYNAAFIKEQLVDVSWIDKTNHKEGKDDEDSIQEYTLRFTFTPKSEYAINNNYPTLERDITFKVNYKGDFSFERLEKKYTANIVKIQSPALISQSYEQDCFYRFLEVECEGYKTKTILKEDEDGFIITDDAGTMPVVNLVLGNKNNVKTVAIRTNAKIANCQEEKEEHKHTKLFNLEAIKKYSFENGDSTWDVLTNINVMPEVQPYKKTISNKDNQNLEFEAAYPYDALNEHLFLWRYLFMHMLDYKTPAEFYISVNSCRYKRTIWFNVHPDVIWAYHMAFDVEEKNILYHDNIKLPLVKGHATYLSQIASLLEKAYTSVKPLFSYLSKSSKESRESWKNIQETVEKFFKESETYMHLGFHARYDIPDGENQKGTLINYSEIQPYRIYLQYQIFKIMLLTLAIDLLMIYLTRGKVAPSMQKAQKIAKRINTAKRTFNSFLKKNNLTLQTPKITMNAALKKEMQDEGAYATIFEYTLKAEPLLALETEYEFDIDSVKIPKKLKNFVKEMKLKTKGKFELIAIAKGTIWYDINIRYNTHTKEFTLNNNATYQEGEYNKVLRDGDIIKTEGNIKVEITAKVSGEIYKEFDTFWSFEPIKVEASFDGELNLSSSVGVIKKFGYTKKSGPYTEKILYFGGLKGSYKQNLEGKLNGQVFLDTDKDDKTVPFTIFQPKNTSLGRDYIFELFEPNNEHQYENKQI